MAKETQTKRLPVMLQTSLLELNEGQIKGLPKNPRFIRDSRFEKLRQSIKDAPEMLDMRQLIVVAHGRKYIVICGNMRLRACLDLGYKELPCHVLPEETPAKKLREYAIKDNIGYGETDWDLVANEWDADEVNEWGLDTPDGWGTPSRWGDGDTAQGRTGENRELDPDDFRDAQRPETGDGEDGEYQRFVDKFKPKLTTDDCYTPPKVYDAVLAWARERCGIAEDAEIMRPFRPGGDYLRETYGPKSVVVDNPPFSIFSKICRNYQRMGVRFFLFAPHLTLFSTSADWTSVVCGVPVTYDNGAVVNTSFASNMFGDVAVMTAPSLCRALREAQEADDLGLPLYSYPDELITSTRMSQVGRYVEFSVTRGEARRVSVLDSQRAKGKGIYGGGYLISRAKAAELKAAELKAAELKAAELKAAELKAAELKAAERWPLSEREERIVEALG